MYNEEPIIDIKAEYKALEKTNVQSVKLFDNENMIAEENNGEDSEHVVKLREQNAQFRHLNT